MSNELSYIHKWATAKLKGDAALAAVVGTRVFSDRVPTGSAFPLVLFQFQAGRDVQGNGTHRAMTRPLYVIRGIVQGPLSTSAQTIADRIDALFQAVASETFEGLVFSSRREQPFMLTETGGDAETRYLHLGGIYRIDTQTAGV